MSSTALVLALSAAVVHALWNGLLAGEDDSEAAIASSLLAGAALWAPVSLATGSVETAAVPYLVVSAALELLYIALLGAAYRVADLSLVYPLARGLAPVLLVVAAVVAGTGGAVRWEQAAGVLVVAGGIVAVRGPRGAQTAGAVETLLAVGVGVTIAGYTLVDRTGVRHGDPLLYLWLALTPVALVYAAGLSRTRGRDLRGLARGALRPRVAVAGVGQLAAYALALAALQRAPAAPVGAVRESSILLVTAYGAFVLHERVGALRAAGAAAVLAGLALVALG